MANFAGITVTISTCNWFYLQFNFSVKESSLAKLNRPLVALVGRLLHAFTTNCMRRQLCYTLTYTFQ